MTRNERLGLIRDRYLVFGRGGWNHALYDIESGDVLVSEPSPWHALRAFEKPDTPDPSMKGLSEDDLMDVRVRRHLHEPIRQIIGGEYE